MRKPMTRTLKVYLLAKEYAERRDRGENPNPTDYFLEDDLPECEVKHYDRCGECRHCHEGVRHEGFLMWQHPVYFHQCYMSGLEVNENDIACDNFTK